MSTPAPVEPWLREVLRCPACRSTLADVAGPALRCTQDTSPAEPCGRTYRFERGVPVLLVDEGELPGAPDAHDRDGRGA